MDRKSILNRILRRYSETQAPTPAAHTTKPTGGTAHRNELGFGTGAAQTQRLINRDGSFNALRVGLSFFQRFNAYRMMVELPFWAFFAVLLGLYLGLNGVFALGFVAIGTDQLAGVQTQERLPAFWEAFFFSVQTFSSVGYGRVNPTGMEANLLAAVDAFIGLCFLALVTGLLFGRFASPRVGLLFSEIAVVAPYEGVTGLMFRVANKYRSHISDLEAFVTLALVRPGPDGKPRREFEQLKLEMDRVYFLVSSWTIVHPIDETSPLWGMTPEEFAEFRGEVLIQFRAVDETFLQNVFVRNSYRFEEVRWNHKFQTVMHTNAEGKTVVDLSKLSFALPVEQPTARAGSPDAAQTA